ncbi:glycosyltransferase [Pseudokineococcus marinus]|uniref:Glycosyltransferase n=1 Tax=Pseudokineococcus marinus TaxID=351215 RepID=A0A849BST9_9ACTN|nr:glycosyltransferase [Pseudokineococcus marinus]NNH23882.1 glycosyltransferase [Pseudokineococcus marinus]
MRAGEGRVVAVVVTYDRLALLREALPAVLAQDRRVDAVVVVDNASTDGTAAWVRAEHPGADLVELPVNTGGAGGFAAGVARALSAHDAGWVWLLDDDTVPSPTALRELLACTTTGGTSGGRAGERVDLVASRVLWTDGREHPMNTPRPRPGASRAERAAAARADAVPVRSASFVSVLVRAERVREVGLPLAAYFLWNDDFEFTTRVLRGRRGLASRRSVVEHRTRVFGDTAADPGERFYVEVRNKLWLFGRSRGLAPWEKALYGASTLRRWARTWRGSRRRGVLLAAGLRGLRDGLLTAPRSTAEVLAAAGAPASARSLAPVRPGSPSAGGAPPADGPLPFSLLLPYYRADRADLLRRAFTSAVHDQHRRPDEVVLVQDGPVDAALATAVDALVAGSPVPVRVVRRPVNGGLAAALRDGLAACRHDVVARMDADDVCLPERFARQLPLLEAGADLVGSGLAELEGTAEGEERVVARRTPPLDHAAITARARFHSPFNHPTVVYRRSAVDAAGGYRDLPLLEDYWLFARMVAAGARTANVPDPLVLYRVDAGSYARRGGARLALAELRLQRELLHEGFTGPLVFARNVAVRGGYRFLPEAVRRRGYRAVFARGRS